MSTLECFAKYYVDLANVNERELSLTVAAELSAKQSVNHGSYPSGIVKHAPSYSAVECNVLDEH